MSSQHIFNTSVAHHGEQVETMYCYVQVCFMRETLYGELTGNVCALAKRKDAEMG